MSEAILRSTWRLQRVCRPKTRLEVVLTSQQLLRFQSTGPVIASQTCEEHVAGKDCQPGAERTSHAVKSFEEIPSARGLPVIGHLDDLKHLYGDGAPRFFWERFLQFGPIYKFRIYNSHKVVLFDHADTLAVLRAEGRLPDHPQINEFSGALRRQRFHDNQPTTFFARSGRDIADIRRVVGRKALVPVEVETLVPDLNCAAEEAVASMLATQDTDGCVSLNASSIKFFMEATGYFLFGRRLGVFDRDKTSAVDRYIAFHDELVESVLDYKWHLLPHALLRWRPGWKRFLRSNARARHIVKQWMDEGETEQRRHLSPGSRTAGGLQNILKEMMDPTQAHFVLDDILTGGAGPASTVMIEGLWQIARRPRVQERLYRELKTVLPGNVTMTSEHLSQLPYLDACFKEAVRLTVPGGMSARHTLARGVTLSGYRVPVGTEVINYHYVMARNPRHFREAGEFRPERWLEGSDERATLHSFHRLVPFGIGPRMCVGKRIAPIAIKLLLAHYVKMYEVRPGMNEDPKLRSWGINMMDREVFVKVTPRTD